MALMKLLASPEYKEIYQSYGKKGKVTYQIYSSLWSVLDGRENPLIHNPEKGAKKALDLAPKGPSWQPEAVLTIKDFLEGLSVLSRCTHDFIRQ